MTRSKWYNAVWRWHFYAGLFTLPFLVLLATTGAVYLFKDEINGALHRDLLKVEPQDQVLAASAIVERATAGSRSVLVAYIPPINPGHSARVVVGDEAGQTRFIFVDPYRGTVLGELPRGQFNNFPLMNLVRSLHSLEIAGWFGNRIIEVVAGWVVILVLSGVYLWWPRGRRGGVVTVRRDAGRRVFWRDLHSVTGTFAAFFILFLALTGLPWSGFWGENLKQALNEAGWGYPPGFWFPVAQSTVHLHETAIEAPWTIANTPLPESRQGEGQPLDLDQVLEIYVTAGLPAGFAVNFPIGPTGVWSASVIPDRVEMTRTMHLDQYSGEVLFDARFGDLGAASKVIEWGTSVHTGQQFGRLNQWMMLLTCISIVLMSVAALIMWWKRRPPGRLGAPDYDRSVRIPRAIVIIPILVGIIFPLVGLSILLVMLIDALLPKMLKARIS